MAKVVVDNQNVVAPWRSRLQLIGVAAGAGAVWWLITSLLARYAIEPLACRSTATLTACGDAPTIAGSVAAVMVAAGALFLLASIRQARPILVITSAAATLWMLGLYVTGLVWYEAIFWSIVAYIFVYVLFATIGRIRNVWIGIATALICVVLIRLFLAF